MKKKLVELTEVSSRATPRNDLVQCPMGDGKLKCKLNNTVCFHSKPHEVKNNCSDDELCPPCQPVEGE